MPSPSVLISTYVHAKDGNRPHLMRRAFAESVALETVIRTDAISLPSSTSGLGAVTDTLVRRFAHEFENVYTFCLVSPPARNVERFSCDWLVGMCSKGSGEIRVGCGRYDWQFQTEHPRLVERLRITIERMQIFSPDCLHVIMKWLSALPYPWCPMQEATKSMPLIQGLGQITEYLQRNQ
jgi:hypothetical protein